MRTLIGRTPVVLARRWLALERLASDHPPTRRVCRAARPDGGARDRRAHGVPGRPRGSSMRSSAAALGDAYPAWGGSAGLTLASRPRRARASSGRRAWWRTRATLPARCVGGRRDRGARGRRGRRRAHAGGRRRGRRLPHHGDADARRASSGSTPASRRARDAPTPWRPGEMLRVVWHWDRCRVYRDAIMVVDVRDAARLTDGRAGLVATRGDAERRRRRSRASSAARPGTSISGPGSISATCNS